MTSHDVVRQVRRIYKTRKVGHGGTLDPLATGVLPVAIGDGTKILQFLLAENKSYRATFQLGVTTDTFDSEGENLLQRAVPDFTSAELERICAGFRGEIKQLPPMFSALKKDGVPLYKLAREGKSVPRELRQVKISRLEIIEFGSESVTIEVDCSKGTYIRTLVNDIGEQFGCGAHLTALRRLKSGEFAIGECLTLRALQQLEQPASAVHSLDEALRNYPAAQLNPAAATALEFGIPPALEQVLTEKDLVEGTLIRLQIDNKLAAVARYMPLRSKEIRGDFELIRVFVGH